MHPLMQQLHDIEGLDSISWWPLAPGWWVLVTLAMLGMALLFWIGVRWIMYRMSWKYDAKCKLAHLENHLNMTTSQTTLIDLSEYLRRIALKLDSRENCAAITGKEWLKWLSDHDPKQFDWEKHGTMLIDLPYAPENRSVPVLEVQKMIQASKKWVNFKMIRGG
jgi:hypothetical protein